MLWDEYRPEFIVTLVLIVVLKKKVLKTITRKLESGDGGIVWHLYIRLSFVKCCNTSELHGISRASSVHDRDSRNLQTGRHVTKVNRQI